ncbi:MAG: glycosyl hydrolase 53 family protein [Lachnospiraceae bacterium]|nr:glycosyl hydrolase 53 family protein [Lachnospiraceae bacterium]
MKRKRMLAGITSILLSSVIALGGCGASSSEPKCGELMDVTAREVSVSVSRIDNLPADFVMGADISSYYSIDKSGATFYDFDGNKIDMDGFFKLLKESGLDLVRFRVWNDPYDEKGRGYGGGNCDTQAAVTMGKSATAAGLQVMIDYHYSDFWADPNKQMTPKAWLLMSDEEKAAALEEFTRQSLTELKEAGVNVTIVSVGNETDNGMSGEKGWTEKCALYNAGSRAVREVFPGAMVAVHYSNPEHDYVTYARHLSDCDVDYDIFGTSYYPYWHGTLENLTEVMAEIAEITGKRVMVLETSWAYTLEDGDGSGNTVSHESNSADPFYSFSVQGQADEIASVTQAIANVGDAALGMLYWEPAWIPVQYYNSRGSDAGRVLESNKKKWEKYGSGWASSYASVYDPDDAGVYYGGSAVDNQALFDFAGHPLDSLNTFRYMREGHEMEGLTLSQVIMPAPISIEIGEDVHDYLPMTVRGELNNKQRLTFNVEWDEAELAQLSSVGEYTVHCTITDEIPGGDGTPRKVMLKVNVLPHNLLINGDFEKGDNTGWEISDPMAGVTRDDPYRGDYALHFWSEGAVSFTASQTVTAGESGEMVYSMKAQGGDLGDGHIVKLVIINESTGLTYEGSVTLTGWQSWKETGYYIENAPAAFTVSEGDRITVTIEVSGAAGGWGTIDDVFLAYKE